jgi:tetratricopeptide (TPR) repeat protein/opacity protein-like surface antigen
VAKSTSSKFSALLFIVLALLQSQAFAQEACREPAGRFASIEGHVQIRGDGQQAWHPAKPVDRLCKGDTIRVGELSRAAVVLVNEAVIRLDQNTTMRLIDISGKKEQRSFLEVVKGAIQTFIRKPKLLSVNTPYLNGSIEGTEFQVRVDEDRASILVLEGRVLASNSQGNVATNPGEMAEAKSGTAPSTRIVAKPNDAVQWTLYYPPVLVAPGGYDNAAAAIEALDKVAVSDRDAAYHLQRAAWLLNVGRHDEAQADIDAALQRDPNAGLAHALRAIIHVVRNERNQALAEADKGVALSDTAATRIALSYAQQADFRIEAARDTLLVAVKNHPEDALAWARLSELWLALGNRREATAAAEKAVSLQPGLGRTQSVLGFAALAEIKTAQAQTAFERAIALDSADPLAHLGLGLAQIRQGHLQEGRGELETAVALDSNNALLRAYLGKAYFEEKRGPLDAQQFGIAKERDPLDPTAYFYNAIRLQTENRPVEALHEVDASIERNDNRAVYRSRLLLDSDEAARGVGLARVYSDLGFQDLALVEGWKSVNTDPSDYSAHRLLADSYAALPRHEIARVSELLQSQLLQPLNQMPIQPMAAEGSLYLISSSGPAIASANEFNSLFNRNQTNLFVSGTGGGLDTASGEAIVSGIHNNVSFSLGASRFITDGFRVNSDQQDNIANAFIQAEVSPDTSLQFEYRYRDTTNGDLQLYMLDNQFSPTVRNKAQTDTYRAGLRHSFSPGSILLGSVIYQVDDRLTHDGDSTFSLDIGEPNDKSLGAELQYLYRSEMTSVTAGAGYSDLDQSQVTSFALLQPFCPVPDLPDLCFPPPPPFVQSTDLSAKHKNAYVYSNIGAAPGVKLTVGASYDSFDTQDTASSESRNQFNPKLGVTWDVRPGTTLRAAAFRVFKRSLITQQTLEPTQVAGFNQFYDDIVSTDSRDYGIGLDQKFSGQTFGGLELSKRDLSVPIPYFDSTTGLSTLEHRDWNEGFGRAYLFMTPSDRVALSMEYQYERIERPDSLSYSMDARTHKVPLGVRFFDPSGWSAGVTGTYVHQDGKFQPFSAPALVSKTSSFWVADATVSYRLPRRQGFLVFGATNLFDEKFSYQEIDFNNPTMQPRRMVFGRLSLAFP